MARVTRRVVLMSLFWAAALPGATQAQDEAISTPPATPDDETIVQPHFVIRPSDRSMGSHFVDMDGTPGTVISDEVTIMNIGDVAVPLKAYVTNVSTADFNGGTQFGVENEPLFEPALWINFEPTELTLEPGESRQVPFSIIVPENVQPHQYVGAFVAETSDSWEIPGMDQFRQVKRYGMLVGVLVPGDKIVGFEIADVSVEDRSIHVGLDNTGNYWLQLSGEVEIVAEEDEVLVNSQITLGRVLAGDATSVVLGIPEQFPSGDYFFNLALKDEGSGQTKALTNVPITIPDLPDPRGLFLEEHLVEANSEKIAFVNVDITIRNGGDQIRAADILLVVSHDRNIVDEFPLANNQVLITGENTLTTRYIPADTWKSGTYTFRVIVYAVDPQGGQQIELLNEDLDAEIVVP